MNHVWDARFERYKTYISYFYRNLQSTNVFLSFYFGPIFKTVLHQFKLFWTDPKPVFNLDQVQKHFSVLHFAISTISKLKIYFSPVQTIFGWVKYRFGPIQGQSYKAAFFSIDRSQNIQKKINYVYLLATAATVQQQQQL